MKAVGLLFDFCLFCNLLPMASCPLPDAPGLVVLAVIAMLLFTPATMEVFAPPTADELLLPTADPLPKRFGCLREFKMC